MKIWKSFGSEHSSNIVMIGKFKKISDAEDAKKIIDYFFEKIPGLVSFEHDSDRFNDEVMRLLIDKNIHVLSPQELPQFRYDVLVEHSKNEIRVRTDEYDISAIQKLMVFKGARVEIFSAHDYPDDSEDGR